MGVVTRGERAPVGRTDPLVLPFGPRRCPIRMLRLASRILPALLLLAVASTGCFLPKTETDEGEGGSAGEGGSGSSVGDGGRADTGGSGAGGAGAAGATEPGPNDWREAGGGITADLFAVWTDGSLVVAVGSEGKILRSADGGLSFTEVESGVDTDLLAVWHAGGVVAVAGAGGTILTSNDAGETFTAVGSGQSEDITALWGSGPNHILAAGESAGVLSSIDGGASFEPVSGVGIRSLWGLDENVVYGLTPSRGMRSEDGGTSWATQWGSYNFFGNLRDIWALSDEYILAVTFGGTVYTYDVDDWSYYVPLPARPIYAVWGTDEHNVFAVGSGGSMLRSASATTCLSSGVSTRLWDVHGANGRAFAVGDDGILIRCDYE